MWRKREDTDRSPLRPRSADPLRGSRGAKGHGSKAFLALLCLLLLVGSSFAQSPAQPVRVATRLIPPFVFEEGVKLTGFSMELWQSIAAELKLNSAMAKAGDVKELLATVKSGRADLGIAAISITAERSKEFDFSQPMFDAGLHPSDKLTIHSSNKQGARSMEIVFHQLRAKVKVDFTIELCPETRTE